MIEPATVEMNLEDVRTFMICSVRYALGRRTYMPSTVATAIINAPKDVLDIRTVVPIIRDLNDYFQNRESATEWNWATAEKVKRLNNAKFVDDKCDYDAWKSLYIFLRQKYSELKQKEEEK